MKSLIFALLIFPFHSYAGPCTTTPRQCYEMEQEKKAEAIRLKQEREEAAFRQEQIELQHAQLRELQEQRAVMEEKLGEMSASQQRVEEMKVQEMEEAEAQAEEKKDKTMLKIKTMLNFFLFIIFLPMALAANSANFKVKPGKLHRKGKVVVNIVPDIEEYRVKMDFDVKKKDFVPVPEKLLKGSTVMEFPKKFRTEAGYKELEKKKDMSIHKADLHFVKRADVGNLKQAYFFEVKPTNKKSKIEIIYHPSLPSVGWLEVGITFISPYPVLDGYELEAVLKQ